MNIEQGISNNEGRFSFVFLRSLLPLWRKKNELKEGATKTQRLKEFNSSKFTSSFVSLVPLWRKKKLVIMNIEQGISNNEGRFSFVFLRSLLPL